MRYFIHLAYRGAFYHGWQRQPNATSVQQTLEDALSMVMRMNVEITGAGRTDTGVNARCMYAHFDFPVPLDKERCGNISKALNRICGPDICIYGIFPVADTAHARFDASLRIYKYFVLPHKNAFLYPLAWTASSPLDYDRMNQAAALLLDTSDFTSFAKLHSDAKTNICHVSHALWTPAGMDSDSLPAADMMVFTIAADRFLRNMVRAVVGTLVDVGRGKLSINDFSRIIESRNRCAAGTSMPPQALFLWDIKYPYPISG